VAEADAFMEKNFTFGPSATGIGVLREKGTDRFVGFAGLLPCRYLEADDYEIGGAFVEDVWNKGYGVEIGLAKISYGFAALKLPRLLALVHPTILLRQARGKDRDDPGQRDHGRIPRTAAHLCYRKPIRP
jgi:RimJ/RimL family protein N-acetyltransferase